MGSSSDTPYWFMAVVSTSAADGDTLRDLLSQFFAPADTPVILAIEMPRLLNAEILRDYFSRLNHR